jgi:hypothetical protein
MPGLSAAHEAADAMVEKMFPEGEIQAQEPAAPAPETTPAETPPAEPMTPAPAQTAPAVEFDEFDFDGQRVKITKDESNAFKILGIKYLQSLRAQEAEQAQAPPPQTPVQPEGPKDPVKLLEERLAAIEKREQDQETARLQAAERQRVESQFASTRSALEASETYKKLSSHPRAQQMLQLMSTGLQYTNGNMTPEEAAKETLSVFEGILKSQQQDYVKSKIESGKNLVEGRGGAAAIPAKPLTKKDLLSGRSEEVAEAMLIAAMQPQ